MRRFNYYRFDLVVHGKEMHMVETLGSRIKQLRKSRHIQQDQLGSLLGMDRTTIHHYENNDRQPSCETLVRLATVFNVTTDFLLGCEKRNIIDISGLTAAETSIIQSLVTNMRQKNLRLEELRYTAGNHNEDD